MDDLINRQDVPDTNVGDLISRQDAIRLAEQGQIQGFEWQFKKLCELPSEEPEKVLVAEVKLSKEDIQDAVDNAVEKIRAEMERKKGKWIYGEKSGQDGWYCSECGGFIPWYYDFYGLDNIDFIEDFKTCPFCDSKMVSYTGANMKEGDIK